MPYESIKLRGDANFLIRRQLFRYRMFKYTNWALLMTNLLATTGFWREIPFEEH